MVKKIKKMFPKDEKFQI